MYSVANYRNALGRLREILATYRPGNQVHDEIVASREQVLARYQPVFAVDHLDSLSAEEFRSFLYLDDNRHWSGLNRLGGRACEDMPKLRTALKQLLDESQPIDRRLDQAVETVPGMGKALATTPGSTRSSTRPSIASRRSTKRLVKSSRAGWSASATCTPSCRRSSRIRTPTWRSSTPPSASCCPSCRAATSVRSTASTTR